MKRDDIIGRLSLHNDGMAHVCRAQEVEPVGGTGPGTGPCKKRTNGVRTKQNTQKAAE